MGPEIDPVLHQPALPLPDGWSRQAIFDTLTTFSIDGSHPNELENYAREDCNRFLYTLSLIPEGPLRILEIGANPYFVTWLIKTFRPAAELTLLNYFGGDMEQRQQNLTLSGLTGEPERHEIEYLNLNIEDTDPPFAEGHFDLILYCEVIEHLLNDPVGSLIRLKKILRPGGSLVLSTPNVARLENVARLVAGANIYDPYSGYGPYGRHNREYNRHELHHLLTYCGFRPEILFTADVHENRAADFIDLSALSGILQSRAEDLGQYLFTRCVNEGVPPERRPAWLYRSYPQGALDMDAVL